MIDKQYKYDSCQSSHAFDNIMKRALWTGAINSARTCNRQTFDGRNVGMMAGSPEACTQEELFHRQLRGRLREGHARATRKIRRSDSWYVQEVAVCKQR